MFGTSTQVAAVTNFGFLSALVQVTPSGSVWLDQIGKLGTIGLLAIAVVALWKKGNEKDEMVIALFKSMTESLASNRATVERMATLLEDMKDTLERMNTSRAAAAAGRAGAG